MNEKQPTLPVTCPNCGIPWVDIPVSDLEGLHCGMSVDCPECGKDIVFGVFTADEYTIGLSVKPSI